MNAHTAIIAELARDTDLSVRECNAVARAVIRNRPRTAEVEYDRGGINLDWRLTISGDGQGVTAYRTISRFRTEERARQVGRTWVLTGVAPADQRSAGL
jgi:hypothetical protein